MGICGPEHVARCLDALATQESAPPFDVIVVYDPELPDMAGVAARNSSVAFIANRGQRSPLELAARAVREAKGDLILLTEDHCIPDPHWVAALCGAQAAGRAAVGGVVDILPDAGPVDWAFYFVDFFRYMPPVREGKSPSLTVCNVSYRRSHVDSISDLWREIFHETAINGALSARFGDLWITPSAVTRMRRTVRFRDALHERYAFGRLFGCTRLEFVSGEKRVFYAITAPALPILLLGRMARKALATRRSAVAFGKSFPALTAMVLAWSVGEWLGYITARRPRSLAVAPEHRQRQRDSRSAESDPQ